MTARLHKLQMTRWLGSLFVVFSLMTSSGTQAAVESVGPISGSRYWFLANGGISLQQFPTVEAACTSSSNFPPWEAGIWFYIGTVPNATYYATTGMLNCRFHDTSTGNDLTYFGATPEPQPVCPVPTVDPSVPYSYNYSTSMCERPAQVACPVTALTQPPFSNACSTSLEAGKGVGVTGACQKAGIELTQPMQDAEKCIAKKIKALTSPPVNYAGPSATIRTTEYQNHLLEIWDKSATLICLMNSLAYTPEYLTAMRQACAQRKAEIDAEKKAHSLDYAPSASQGSADHVKLQAIDVSKGVVNKLIDRVTTYTTTYTMVNGIRKKKQVVASDVEDYLHSAPDACGSNVHWGGPKPDNVHFYLK